MAVTFNARSARAREARLARRIGRLGYRLLIGLGLGLGALGVWLMFTQNRLAWAAFGIVLLIFEFLTWYHWQLAPLPPGSGEALDQKLASSILGELKWPVSVQSLWTILLKNWQTRFLLVRLSLHPDWVNSALQDQTVPEQVWQTASELAQGGLIESGHLAAAIITTTPELKPLLARLKLQNQDVAQVAAWANLARQMDVHTRSYFGGLARDWSSGYTPLLDSLGTNLSHHVEAGQYFYLREAHAETLDLIVKNLDQGHNAVALVGAPGSGKTTMVWRLAKYLLEGHGGHDLAYHQVVSLDAAVIAANVTRAGELESLFLQVLSEAARAGNVVLFFDNAHLFFGSGAGAVDLSKVLLPVLQKGAVRLIMDFEADSWQRLKATNSALVGLFNVITLAPTDPAQTMAVLQEQVLMMDGRNRASTTLGALKEAYRLAERYMTDEVFPGRGIKLIEAAHSFIQDGLVTEQSVQQAVEQSTGVKAASAKAPEAAQLLKLEELIHQRMINQSRAVGVVADALRRSRAGVASPKRPIGSFLFLGPTGVGKTELAKSIAAVYFGSAQNMVRLDMSEYQQSSDLDRLLDGSGQAGSLAVRVREQPFTVVLLDEVEKAHPNILNLLLQVLDEGQLTDSLNRAISFKDCIIIATSNAGADEIRKRLEQGQKLEDFEKQFTDDLINSHQFRPELLNRFDAVVLFRPLTPEELKQVVGLQLAEVNQTLADQNVKVMLTEAAAAALAQHGYDPRLGARPLRRLIQRSVEDFVAKRILAGQTKPGDTLTLDAPDLVLAD